MFIEYLLTSEPTLVKEAWTRMKGWYKDATGRTSSTARIIIGRITEERSTLYQKVPSHSNNIPVMMVPFEVDN